MKQRLAFAYLSALVLGAYTPGAHANGRFPAANQLVINPTDASHFVVRTTFGFVETTDAGQSFRWICEGVVSRTGVQDPPIALTGDGTLIVAVPFEGVTVSHDHGCTWEQAPAPLAEQFAVDVTLDPGSTSNLLVLTSTADASLPAGSDPEFINLLVETRDNARSWRVFGSPLPRDFIAAAFDAAPSKPDRIYVSGVVGDPPSAVVERSDDRGASWTRFTMPLPERPLGVFLSAIHPRDADRLWIRILFDDLGGSSPTSLYRTDDGGETWTEVAATADGMLGFALSPDGETLAYGSLAGVFSGPAAGNVFAPLAIISNRCLTWSASGLYACGTEPTDPFAVGLARSPPAQFEPLYRLAQTCPQDCPETSQFGLTCQKPWSDPQGVAALTRARVENCGDSEAAGGSSAAGASPIEPRSTNAQGACTLAYSASGGATLWVIVVCAAASARRRNTRVKPQKSLSIRRSTIGMNHAAGASNKRERGALTPRD